MVSFRKTMTLTVSGRYFYLNRMLESLQKNALEGYHLIVSVEPSGQPCSKILDRVDFIPKTVIYQPRQLGIRLNPFWVMDHAFSSCGSQFNLYLEDDIILSPDAVSMADWFFEDFLKGGSETAHCGQLVLCLNLFNRSFVSCQSSELFLTKDFDALGVGITSSCWKRYFNPWWFEENHSFSGKGHWDHSIRGLLVSDPSLYVVKPHQSRSRHIGLLGSNMNPTLQAAVHDRVMLQGLPKKREDVYKIVGSC